jgi:hypothetical protein
LVVAAGVATVVEGCVAVSVTETELDWFWVDGVDVCAVVVISVVARPEALTEFDTLCVVAEPLLVCDDDTLTLTDDCA